MGSRVLLTTAWDYYILGLWLADGYWWSSSIGLSSTHPQLIERFRSFLARIAPSHTIKWRIYKPDGMRKTSATHVYVNSRMLVRYFMKLKEAEQLHIPSQYVPAYIAGRIDGDGAVDRKNRSGIRIAYSNFKDADRDRKLLGRNNTSIYHYQAAKTWVLYLRKQYRDRELMRIGKFSIKLLPRRD